MNETISATNFNPIGTPDAALSPIEDADTNDTYLSKITVRKTFNLTYQQIFAINPPPGFNNPEEIRILLKSATKKVD